MSRTEARVKVAIWRDTDFQCLSLEAKATYLFLLSQPDLSWCGVLAERLPRWSATLPLPVARLSKALGELATARFIVWDPEQGEVLIRTFMRNDGVLAAPNWSRAAQRSLVEVSSPKILEAIAAQLPPDLRSEWGLADLETAFTGSIDEGIEDSIDDCLTPSEGVRGKGIGVRGKEVILQTVQFEVETSRVAKGDPKPSSAAVARDVYEAWLEAGGLNPRQYRLTDARRQRVAARLRDGYEAADLVLSGRGVWQDQWCTEHGKTDMEWALRNGANVERFRDLAAGGGQPGKRTLATGLEARYEAAKAKMAEERGGLG